MKFIVERSKYLLAILALLLGWWWLALLVDNSALPEPYLAVSSFIHGLQGGLLLHLRVSFFRVLISLSLAVFLGVPSGLILGRDTRPDQYLAPVLPDLSHPQSGLHATTFHFSGHWGSFPRWC